MHFYFRLCMHLIFLSLPIALSLFDRHTLQTLFPLGLFSFLLVF